MPYSIIDNLRSYQLIIMDLVTLTRMDGNTHYGTCSQLTKDDFLYDSLVTHSNKNIKPMAYGYLGLGHYGVIIDDGIGNYHCLFVGGSNGYERLECSTSYQLYTFNNPSGKIDELSHETEIVFNKISMNPEVLKLCYELLDDDCPKTEEDFHEKIKQKLQANGLM